MAGSPGTPLVYSQGAAANGKHPLGSLVEAVCEDTAVLRGPDSTVCALSASANASFGSLGICIRSSTIHYAPFG